MRRNVTRTEGLGSSDGWMPKEVLDKQSTTAMHEQPCIESQGAPEVSLLSSAMMEQRKVSQLEQESRSPVNVISQQ